LEFIREAKVNENSTAQGIDILMSVSKFNHKNKSEEPHCAPGGGSSYKKEKAG